MMNDFSQFTQEELQQLMGLGSMDERQQLVRQQLAQAQALRDPISGQHSTGMGAALGGLGDVFRGIGGQAQGSTSQGKMMDLLKQQDIARLLYSKGIGGVGGSAGMGDIPMSSSISLGG